MSRPTPRHKAPARHKAPRRSAGSSVRPTIVAVTCAGLGVAGTVGAGQFLVDNVVASAGSVVAAGEQDGARAQAAGRAQGVAANQGGLATGQATGETDGDKRAAASARGAASDAAKSDTTDSEAETSEAESGPTLFSAQELPAEGNPPVAIVETFDGDYAAPKPVSGKAVLDRTAIERKRAQERADRAAARQPTGSAQEIAKTLLLERGWDEAQYSCLVPLWTNESNWSHTARNPSSGAYGIPQALPGSKMASAGADWETNPTTQIKWGLDYIAGRYGTPCGAWSFWQANNWY